MRDVRAEAAGPASTASGPSQSSWGRARAPALAPWWGAPRAVKCRSCWRSATTTCGSRTHYLRQSRTASRCTACRPHLGGCVSTSGRAPAHSTTSAGWSRASWGIGEASAASGVWLRTPVSSAGRTGEPARRQDSRSPRCSSQTDASALREREHAEGGRAVIVGARRGKEGPRPTANPRSRVS